MTPDKQAERQALVSCPFCGCADIFIEPDEIGSGGQWVGPIHVGCKACKCEQCADDEDDAVAAWNRRSHLSDAQKKPLDDPRLQELFSAAIDGALTSGFQGVSPAPEGHWLAAWWQRGRGVALESNAEHLDVRNHVLERAMQKLMARLATMLEEDQFAECENIVQQVTTPQAAAEAPAYPLPDSLYPGSKDWMASNYAGRVEWLHVMYESAKRTVAMLERALATPTDSAVNAGAVLEKIRAVCAKHGFQSRDLADDLVAALAPKADNTEAPEVSDKDIREVWANMEGFVPDPVEFVRAVLALRTKAQPLTEEQIERAWYDCCLGDEWIIPPSSDQFRFARAIERAHGIASSTKEGS